MEAVLGLGLGEVYPVSEFLCSEAIFIRVNYHPIFLARSRMHEDHDLGIGDRDVVSRMTQMLNLPDDRSLAYSPERLMISLGWQYHLRI